MQSINIDGQQHSVLPVERTRPTSRKTLALTIDIVLLSGVALNTAVKHVLRAHPELDNPTYAAFYEQWDRLLTLEEPVETLILGDSSCRQGVDPEVLDIALGTRSLNLCTMGNAATVNSVWQLSTYIERHGAPKRVILIHVHDVWKRAISLPLLGRIPLRWGYWERLPPGISPSREQLQEVFLAGHVPLYSQDRTITKLLLHPLDAGKRRVQFTSRGFAPVKKKGNPEAVRRDEINHLRHTVPHGWRISQQSRRALRSMTKMADREGFDLYIGSSPLSSSMVEAPAFRAYLDEGHRVISDLIADSARARVILHPPVSYPREEMRTSDRVTAKLVPDFTRRVAAAVTAVERDE
jgi:hypothetical protein